MHTNRKKVKKGEKCYQNIYSKSIFFKKGKCNGPIAILLLRKSTGKSFGFSFF